MSYPPRPKRHPASRDRARHLRRAATDAEQELWWHIRRKLHVERSYFRRQVPLGPYFADFACLGLKLVVELDGSQHARQDRLAHDLARTRYLESRGFRVLRFWNDDVFNDIESVLDTILASME